VQRILLDNDLLLNTLEHIRLEKDISKFKEKEAKDILNNVLKNENTSNRIIARLSRPVAFGYFEAKTIHSLLGGKGNFSNKIGEIGGIYVAWICYFDELFDKSPGILKKITKHIDKNQLSKQIYSSAQKNDIFLGDIPNDFQSNPFILLWQSYIEDTIGLYKSSKRKDVWDEFVKTISTQYFQELDCIDIKIPEFHKNLWQTIMSRSCSPLWVNFLICFLSDDIDLKFYLPKLRNSIIKLGEVAKIIDDIVDLISDFKNRRWNYIFIKARENHPSIFDDLDRIDDLEIIQSIIDKGIIDECILEACKTYHIAIEDLKKIGLYTKDFEQYLKLFFSNWFK
jgi:hypothetical protein